MAVLTRRRLHAAEVLRSGRVIPLGLSLGALALAFAQRPGHTYRDTRIELTVDPGLFLDRVASAWSPNTDLGHVQSGQWVGYLWPMGPWHAFAEWLGVPMWIAQRLWLALLLALAAWGAVRLMDELYDTRRGLAHVVAGVIYAVNPYVATYADRSGTLLAYVALPWLLVAAHRGLARPRDWLWSASMGLIVASAGGGLNAATVAWVVAAPVGLIAYEVAVLGRRARNAAAFGWRAGLCVALGSLWWGVPVLLHTSYGADFLTFTEQPRAILASNSMSESLRLLGFWLGYFGVGFLNTEAVVPGLGPYLFKASTIVGSFLVPLLAFGALRWTRRWSYAPFFGLLGGLALVVMALGFPPDSPVNDAVIWTYYNVPALQFLRTTYKAAPLLAIALACLGGAGVVALLEYLRAPGLRLLGTRIPAWTGLVLVAASLVLWARPFVSGHIVDARLAYGEVPQSWEAAVGDANRDTAPDRRIMLMPGELFGWHRWGGTYEPVGPALSRRPLIIRELDRYADPRSAQLQVSVDDLVQQGRLVPGQLAPLLRLQGVGEVLVTTDGRRLRDGALDPVGVTRSLEQQPGFDRPAGRYGNLRLVSPAAGWGGAGTVLPDLRRYDIPGSTGPGIVRVHPRANATVLDGDADGIVELAAHGRLDPERALFYASDFDRREVADAVRQGSDLVFTDSNRRSRVIVTQLVENRGATLGPNDPLPRDDPRYDPFPERGSAGRTVAFYSGLRWLRANTPEAGVFALHPQERPYAALDGRRDTAWISRSRVLGQGYLEFALRRPVKAAWIDVYPHFAGIARRGPLGVTINGGQEEIIVMKEGRNRIPFLTGSLSRLRLRVPQANIFGITAGADGLSEVRVPGLRVRETLRLPTYLATTAQGLDLAGNSLTVLLSRTTTDFPYRTGTDTEHPEQSNVRDAEPGLVRDVTLPVRRTYRLRGWASVDPAASDVKLDRLTGLPGPWRFDSSSRFEGVPGRRASSAFDGDDATAWVGGRGAGGTPWLRWQAPRPLEVRRLRLRPGPAEYPAPSRVRLSTAAGPLELPVSRHGLVQLPRPVETDTMRIDVIGVRLDAFRRRRGVKAVAIGEVVVPGLRPPRIRRTGKFATSCGALSVQAGGSRADVRVSGSLADLDAGRPLVLAGCGPRRTLGLPEGRSTVVAAPASLMRLDQLRLRSPAPSPQLVRPTRAVVSDPGRAGNGRREDVRVALSGPSWLVLGESYSRGWRAWCRNADGGERALGAPVPIDGFANGWPVDATCRDARFAFAPQRLVNVAYVISLLALVAMLAVVVAYALRRRGPALLEEPEEPIAAAPADPVRQLAWTRALSWSAAAGLPTALLYGALPGVIVAVVLLVLGREGLSSRRLLAVAALALAALPVLYLLNPSSDLGSFNFDYARDHLDAHKIAAVAVVCLIAACGIEVNRLRARRARR